MINKIFLLLILVSLFGIAQEIKTPLEDSGFKKLSSYNDLTAFVTRLPMISPLVKIEVIGKTKEGRSLFAVKISDKEFGIDKKKIKVLLFAQQHGNEPSGKEGALLLIKELLKKEYRPLLKNVDIVIVPQVNPDGAEKINAEILTEQI